MADEQHLTIDTVGAESERAGEQASPVTAQLSQTLLASGKLAAYPASEIEYWREAYLDEPYYEAGHGFEDYSPAYEVGWLSYSVYGGPLEAVDRVMANDWDVRKGISSLSWEQARPAARAAWQRAHNARSFVSDGSAGAQQVLATLNELLQDARDGELAFREAAENAKAPMLQAVFGRRADSYRQAAAELQEQIQGLGGKPDETSGITGAAQRLWAQIRGLFRGASDEAALQQCERGEDAAMATYCKALQQNLPLQIHAMVRRQFEGVQRNRDMIASLRERARAEGSARTDDAA